MPQYSYPLHSLGSDSIRLLRLLPNKDETAPIRCRLRNYPLQISDNGTHLYEALSYVWGSSDKLRSVFINKHYLPVTVNLHAALSRLRDRTFERIIWVDSVCINQADEQEKERQIQSMAKIYGQANRVIVYLGEATDDSDQALEDIRVAADESTTSSNSEKSQKAILKLLERPWFRRIWEVAAARRILIKCGSTEIDGYAFCLGFNKLELSYKAHPELQSLIRSVTYLIRGAIFRPKYATSPPGGLSLGELIDIYHAHEATERRDKVYALLGMSSDDPSAAGLSPNYTVPWKELFQRLIKFVLFKEVSAETWDKREIAVIKSKGFILGQVSSVESDSAQYDRQHVEVIFNNSPRSVEYNRKYGARWTLQASAKFIWKRDVVCLLQGASNPTIIRPYKDHFAVIMIAVTIRQYGRTKSGYIGYQDPLDSTTSFSHDFLLTWNWEKSPGNIQDGARYETSVEINTLVPEYLKTALSKAVRLYDLALALRDSKEYEEAEKRIQEVIEGYERAFGKENPYTLAVIDNLALIYQSQGQWEKAEDLFLQVIQTRKRVQGSGHQNMLSSIANLASTYIYQLRRWRTGTTVTISSLPDRIRDNVQITEEEMVPFAEYFGKKMITLLLDLKRDNVPVTEEVVKAAAANSFSGKEVMALLLDKRRDEVKITEEVAKAAARNWDYGNEVIELLLDQCSTEVKITEDVVKAAARNKQSGKEIMALLLSQRSDEVKITEEVVKEAARNESREVMELLLELRGNEVKIIKEVLKEVLKEAQ